MTLLPLETWLHDIDFLTDFTCVPLAGDASARRYFRVCVGSQSYIAMDASLERSSCTPFVAIADALRALGVMTPRILAKNIEQGYLLISDFGDDLYLKCLHLSNADDLYARALNVLGVMQTCHATPGWTLPFFNAEWMAQEFILFQEWYLEKYLKFPFSKSFSHGLANVFEFLIENIVMQPTVFMHRDFHSANLLVLPGGQVGVLDFQDAFMGPVTYDLVSLLRDCYIAWPPEKVQQWALQFYVQQNYEMHFSEVDFLRWFDLMGLQRHLKALMTFSRKYCRDNNSNYIQHIPRTLNYILQVSQHYPQCEPLLALEAIKCEE